MSNLTVTSSPHIFTPRTTRSIMLDVLIALLLAAVASVILFGFSSLRWLYSPAWLRRCFPN